MTHLYQLPTYPMSTTVETKASISESKASISIPSSKVTPTSYLDKDVEPSSNIVRRNEHERKTALYPEFLPVYNRDDKFELLAEAFNKSFSDRGHLADSLLRNLFPPEKKGEYEVKQITPKLGDEITGIQLSQLDDAAKNDLALYAAQRGILIFRNQDLKDKSPEFHSQLGSYFGPLHIHPTSPIVEGHPELLVVYRKEKSDDYAKTFEKRLTGGKQWHSDITFEEHPAGTTFFTFLQGPESGGDTLFSDGVEAYKRLSPTFQKVISQLKAVHGGARLQQLQTSQGAIQRRPFPASVHPLVRIHPVTKEKSLFASGFITEIEGLKKEESDAILNLLFDHVSNSHDLQIRASYEPGTVVVWDNRRVLHTATIDWEGGSARHCLRITPQAERPVQEEEELEEWNR